MIILYETGGCSSCRKVKKWLKENNLEYRVVNTRWKILRFDEVKFLFSLSSDIYDIVSLRSNAVKNFRQTHGYDIEDLSFNRLVNFIINHPSAMRHPILTDGKHLVSGYDADELTVLLPPEKRGWTARIEL